MLKSQKVPRLYISWKKCTLLFKCCCESIFKVYILRIIWHTNCITLLACLPWYIVHDKMFSVALLAYGNHEPHFLFVFFSFVCVCTHAFKNHSMLHFLFSPIKRNILHGKDKCKHSFSLFLFCLRFWLRKFLALIGFLWV